jgi:hypothetical protein
MFLHDPCYNFGGNLGNYYLKIIDIQTELPYILLERKQSLVKDFGIADTNIEE